MNNYKHWKLATDNDNILWLTLDRADAKVNSLNREVFDEFDQVVDDIAQQNPVGVILQSAKSTGFIAGADITQFTALKDEKEAFDLIRQAQLVLDKFEALPMPTLAIISGFCLGGGCETALACTYRIAEITPSTRIGLPEVKLGIIPGWGGTVRLPKLIGAPAAMKIMLAGMAVDARKAKKIGLVDQALPKRELLRAAKAIILSKPAPHQPKGWSRLSNESWVRPWLGKMIEKNLRAKVNPHHYPAPFVLLHKWIKEGVGTNSYIAEANEIAKLLVTDISRNMVRDFFLQTALKAQAKVAKCEIKNVHVIGAGTMGGDIAAWCAYKGFNVTLQDQSAERIAPAMQRAYKLYKKKLKKPHLIQAVLDRLQPDLNGYGVAKADLVIEAIFEDLKVKQDLFKSLEPKLKANAILATNTSSIPLDEINTVLAKPERLVGIHYFNPVPKMPLVEVVHGSKTSLAVKNAAQAFVGKISKLPLPVKSSPGFLVNRCLMPYLMEAVYLLEEGYAPLQIDKAATEFGMPMGPIELADKVGLDVALSVAKNLVGHYGGQIPERLEKMVEAGYLGVKSGRGFYEYQNGKKQINANDEGKKATPEIADRMILRMLNEAVACLHEKVVEDMDLLDGGMIFGTGFAPFRGGPLHYAQTRGVDQIVERLNQFTREYGERYKPFIGWEALKGSAATKKCDTAENAPRAAAGDSAALGESRA